MDVSGPKGLAIPGVSGGAQCLGYYKYASVRTCVVTKHQT
jgi:hypothetical protein